jgi:Uma2 family endonuclease
MMSQVASNPIRFTVSEYLRMSEAGLFGDRKTELIKGKIKKMAPQMNPHRWAISKISRLLVQDTTPKDWLVIRGTLFVDDLNAPQPDFQLFDVPEGTPDEKLPPPILVIEVSHTTYRRDSGTKLRLYAGGGIPDYWIVNLRDRRVEVYRDPQNPTGNESDCRYATVTHFGIGQTVAVLKRPKTRFKVEAMLP